MIRRIENTNPKQIVLLLQKINLGIDSMIHNYTNLYSAEEIKLLYKIHKLIFSQTEKVKNNKYCTEEIYKLLRCEEILKEYAFRCWNFESKNGNQYISWFKNDKLKNMSSVISSTFSNNIGDSFCGARYGINYDVPINGFLGACNKDAATLIEDRKKLSIYTIGTTNDNKVINSYNLATPIITPIQVFDKSLNNFKSKHNEVILDSRYIKPISVVYTDPGDRDIVNLISSKYNIPIEYKEVLNSKDEFTR